MKMKHPKVTGIIKAYKSLKQLWLLFFPSRKCKNEHAGPQLIITADNITPASRIHVHSNRRNELERLSK